MSSLSSPARPRARSISTKTSVVGLLSATFAFGCAALGCGEATSGVGGAGGSASSLSGPSTSVGTTGSGTTSSSKAASTGSGVGGGASCAALPVGPLVPSPIIMTLDGSEDLAFDGKGHIAAKKGPQIVLVDAMGTETHLADFTEGLFGLRYRADGNLVGAVFGSGKLVEISPAGVVTDLVSGLGLPNGVYPDAGGNVWVTETSAGKVTRVNPDKSTTTIVAAAPAANGIVFDAMRDVVFFTNYAAGKILRVDPGGGSQPVPVTQIVGAKLDGLVLDACGNLYAVDQGNAQLYRVELDAVGDTVTDPKLLATFPKSVANAQFGSGPGFSPTALYVTGTPGTIYELEVGVAGATVVTPP